MRNAMVRKPTHPGIFLKEDYMVPLGLSQAKIAKLLHVNKRTIHELCTQKRGLSALMALKLEKLFTSLLPPRALPFPWLRALPSALQPLQSSSSSVPAPSSYFDPLA